MKKFVLSSCVSLFALCLLSFAGCPKPEVPPPPASESNTPTAPGVTTEEGLTLPLEPTDRSKAELPQIDSVVLTASSFAKVAQDAAPTIPVADLVGQIDEYVERIGKNLDDLDGTVKYKSDADTIVRDTNALSLVALSVGMAQEDSKYKKAAPAIIKASMELAKVEKYDDAKKAYEALKASLTSEGDPSTLAWTKVAELPPLMKAVPNLSSTLTRLTNTDKKLKRGIERNPERIYGALAALAAITQGSVANAKDTTKPDAEAEWKKECEQFRNAAIKANAAAHGFAEDKVSYADYWKAFKEMTDTCDQCHEIFYPNAVGKAE